MNNKNLFILKSQTSLICTYIMKGFDLKVFLTTAVLFFGSLQTHLQGQITKFDGANSFLIMKNILRYQGKSDTFRKLYVINIPTNESSVKQEVKLGKTIKNYNLIFNLKKMRLSSLELKQKYVAETCFNIRKDSIMSLKFTLPANSKDSQLFIGAKLGYKKLTKDVLIKFIDKGNQRKNNMLGEYRVFFKFKASDLGLDNAHDMPEEAEDLIENSYECRINLKK